MSENAASDVINSYKNSSYLIFEFPDGIFSKDTFFNGVRATLPLDPPLTSNHSWDALNDSLWSGLELLPEEKLLIIWRTANKMRTHDIHNFKIACNILEDLPKSICDSKKREGKEASLAIVVVI